MDKTIKNIVIIADNYPTQDDPVFPFVAQLSKNIVKVGINVTVIAPQSIIKYLFKGAPKHPKIKTEHFGEHTLTIFQPWCFSFSNVTPRINFISRRKAVERCFDRLKIKPDVCYGHFWHSGYNIYRRAKQHNIPLFIATGESDIRFTVDNRNKEEFCDYVRGVICVSSKNKEESIVKGLTIEEKCIVIPNAIDNNIFKILNKQSLRNDLSIKDSDFVVAFVGWFSERKGSLRVSNALNSLNNNSIKSIFIGSGEAKFEPKCDNIVFKGRLPHNEIPKYLNAADVFVLPTLKEGCCNAVIEAMACGLPIISSDLSFNYDVLDETNSIMINPNDENAIAKAIIRLVEDRDLSILLADGAIAKAKTLTIGARAHKILTFIKNRL